MHVAMHPFHWLGITGVHNMEGAIALRAFQELRRSGELKLRVLQQVPELELDAAIQLGIQKAASATSGSASAP